MKLRTQRHTDIMIEIKGYREMNRQTDIQIITVSINKLYTYHSGV